MATKIEWTDETWSPVTGCTPISAGCKNCYAKRMARRLAGRCGYPEKPHHFDVTLHPDRLEQPLHWRKPRRVFVCSMSDLFHPDVPFTFISEVFGIMALTPHVLYQVLTKRPDRMKEYFDIDLISDVWYLRDMAAFIQSIPLEFWPEPDWPLPNVWLGVTVENQQAADERIPLLLKTPAAVRFVSCEPLLGSIDLDGYVGSLIRISDNCTGDGVDWVIAGGETGPSARPMHPDWAQSLRDQCQNAGVPFFFKQFGEYVTIPHAIELGIRVARATDVMNANTIGGGFVRVGKKRAGRLLDGRLWEEYPA